VVARIAAEVLESTQIPNLEPGSKPEPESEIKSKADLNANLNANPNPNSRWKASEDMTRILHTCLEPLEDQTGVKPYQDRIHASHAASSLHQVEAKKSKPTVIKVRVGHDEKDLALESPMSHQERYAFMQLVDNTLPTGGFAHSGGLEAATQQGVFGGVVGNSMRGNYRVSERDLVDFMVAAAHSQLSLNGPFLLATHQLATSAMADPSIELCGSFLELDAELNSLLVPNAPAMRASITQGVALAGVAESWLSSRHSIDYDGETGGEDAGPHSAKLIEELNRLIDMHPGYGHAGTVMGCVAASLGLKVASSLDALAYTTSRDMLAAAVRLNLVGPMRAVQLQHTVAGAICDFPLFSEMQAGSESLRGAAGSAPLLEATHSGHDMLEMRLFQT